MMKFKKTLVLAAALVLSACGNDTTATQSRDAFNDLKAAIKVGLSRDKDTETAVPDPTAAIDNALKVLPGVPLQFILSEKTHNFTIASVYGVNAGVTTWVTAEKRTLSFDGPMLTATRGFGFDVMSVDSATNIGSLIRNRRSGSYEKTYRFLNGLDNTGRLVLNCTLAPTGSETVQSGEITAATTIVQETCAGSNHKFTNTYWIDAQGRAVQSIQWAGSGIGMLIVRQLRH